jgi:hypothetical protein
MVMQKVQLGCREELVDTYKMDFTPRKESRLDNVLGKAT